jgi:hypothetical protein
MTPETVRLLESSDTTITHVKRLIILRTEAAERTKLDIITKGEIIPDVELPRTAILLFNSKRLWIPVEELNTEFTPRAVVVEPIIRWDGLRKMRRLFSVWIANQTQAIKETYGLVPISVFDNQRSQYWNREFVEAFYTHMWLQHQSVSPKVNKMAYVFAEFDPVRLTEVFDKTNNNAEKTYQNLSVLLRGKLLQTKKLDIL